MASNYQLYTFIGIALYIFSIDLTFAPLPNRAERAAVPTLANFYDEVDGILRDFQRHLEQTGDRPSDSALTLTENRLQIAARSLHEISNQIVDDDNLSTDLLNAHTSLVSLLTDLRQHRQDQGGGEAATGTSASTGHRTRQQLHQPISCSQLESLLSIGITVSDIAKRKLLGPTSRQTIYKYMKRHGIQSRRQRYSDISLPDLQNMVRQINHQHPNSGAEEVNAFLRTQEPPVIVHRQQVRDSLSAIDPIGTASRWAQAIHRRRYSVPSPNSLWHLDTHHPLIRWKFVVHGAIDGFSRLVPFLRVAGDNCARTALMMYLYGIRRYSLPSRIRVDGGGEYAHIRTYMERELGNDRGTVLTGRSVHNQRVERLWRDVYTKVLDLFYKMFYHLEDNHCLDVTNNVQLFCLHYVFLPRIDILLQRWATAHNNHRIRTEHNQTPLQLWFGGVVERSSQQTTAINNVFTHTIEGGDGEEILIENGIDWDLSDPERIVNVQLITNPLNIQNRDELLHRFPLDIITGNSGSHGIDIYGNVLAFVEECLSQQESE